MSNWTATIERYIAEGKTVSGGKGDKTAKASEVAQANFTNTLTKAFQAQYGKQSDLLAILTKTLSPQLANPTGLSAATKAAMTTNAIETSATTFQNALKGTQAITASHGGPTALPSGVQEQITGQLAGQQAASETSGLENIQQQDENLKQSNYWNAVNGLNGVAAQTNPLGYANGATGSSGAVAGLSQAFTQSNQSQLLGALGGVVGGGLSAAGSIWGNKKP